MNFSAVSHSSLAPFCYAADEEELIINIKTGYDIKHVFIHYGDPYLYGILGGKEGWAGERSEIVYKKNLTEHIWWTTTLKPEYKRCRYYFELTDGIHTFFYFEDGFLTKEQTELPGMSLQYFVMPWLNGSDVNKTPEWVGNTIWYQIFPERFCNGNTARNHKKIEEWREGPVKNSMHFGGDIEGIISKLDYLKNLGITGLYLNPIFESPSVHKYDTTDYKKIDPAFGDEAVMKEFVEEAHKRGMRVMLDGVFNHCGSLFAPWQHVLKNGPQSPYFHWFMINRWPLPTERKDTKDQCYYSFAFEKSMPKLNTNEPEVIQYFVDICRYWVETYDVDGIRLDVANEVSHFFLKELRKGLREVNEDFYILGEIWHNAAKWLSGDQLHGVMNYPLASSIGDFWIDKKRTKRDFEYDINRCYTMYMQQTNRALFNLLDSHDTDRLRNRVDNLNQFFQQLAVLFTMPGSPCIYYGTEIALEGGHDPDCRRCMPWEKIEKDEYQEITEDVKRLIQLRKQEKTWGSLYFHFPNEQKESRCIEYRKIDEEGNQIEVLLNCGLEGISVKQNGDVLYSRLYQDGIIMKDGILIRNIKKEPDSFRDLGMSYSKNKTVLTLYAPTADAVRLNLYKTGSDEEEGAGKLHSYAMKKDTFGVWRIELTGDRDGIYYTYEVEIEGIKRETQDPYAVACGINGDRSMIVDLSTTDPEGWREDASFRCASTQPIIYELHVKDFSNDINSGISKEHRGKYLAFTEDNTTYQGKGEWDTCVSYIKKLGVTHVHLLPIFDFASVDEAGEPDQFNWGYDPKNYNVPEGSYATNPWDGKVRIRECKQMIKALHDAGIGVILDVVYNHTYDLNSSFQKTAPDYYYRRKKDGSYANGSACGNETASERFLYHNYIKKSVLYWAKEYHMDGFRFDLMGLHPIDGMNDIRAELNDVFPEKQILLYGEPWAAEEPSMDKGSIPAMKHHIAQLSDDIAIFCDDIRDAVKGHVFDVKAPGFINGGDCLEKKIQSAVTAYCISNEKWKPNAPSQIITYVSAHDNYTLWDKLLLSTRNGTEKPDFSKKTKHLLSMNRLAAAILFTSFGIPFFQAGEEFGRTKQGEENSYCSPAALNQLDWARTQEFEDLVKYYIGLIQFRKKADSFYNGDRNDIKLISFEEPQEAGVVIFLHERSEHKKAPWKKLYVIYNSTNKQITVPLPPGNWNLLIHGERSDLHQTVNPIRKEIPVKEKSATVLGYKRKHSITLDFLI